MQRNSRNRGALRAVRIRSRDAAKAALMSRQAIFEASVSYFLEPIAQFLADESVSEIMVNGHDCDCSVASILPQTGGNVKGVGGFVY